MKNQALFSSKDKSKKLKCRLMQFLFDALRVKSTVRGQSLLIIYCSIPTLLINIKKTLLDN